MSRLREIMDRKEQRKARLEASLEGIVGELKSLGALKIVLFGSMARGDIDVNSDLDLFVLMPPAKTGKEWMDVIYSNSARRVAANIIVYNQREYEEKIHGSHFLMNVARGKVVYEKAA